MSTIDKQIVCCYLYSISKHGYPPPAQDTLKHLVEMKQLGFKSVELEGIHQAHLGQINEMRSAIREKLDHLELTVPYFCIVLPGLSSAKESESLKNLELFERGCDLAQALGSQAVLDNGPLPPYEFPETLPVVRHYDDSVLRTGWLPVNLDWKVYWQGLVETYRAACDIAAQHGLTYHIHPCEGSLCATSDGFLYFRDAVGRDNLRFNFDTANLFFMRENLPLALRRLADSVDYIHLSDNRGHKVEHLSPPAGAIDWSAFFETLDLVGFSGHLGIDIGGAESEVEDLDQAYADTAKWLMEKRQPSATREGRP